MGECIRFLRLLKFHFLIVLSLISNLKFVKKLCSRNSHGTNGSSKITCYCRICRYILWVKRCKNKTKCKLYMLESNFAINTSKQRLPEMKIGLIRTLT